MDGLMWLSDSYHHMIDRLQGHVGPQARVCAAAGGHISGGEGEGGEGVMESGGMGKRGERRE